MTEQEQAQLKHALYILQFLSKNRNPIYSAMIQEAIAAVNLTLSNYDNSIYLPDVEEKTQLDLSGVESRSSGIVNWLTGGKTKQ